MMSKVPLPDLIMGINSRNRRVIKPYNPVKFIRRINSKIASKKLLEKAGVAVPMTYHTVTSFRDVATIPWAELEGKSFVIKPDRGSGGNGIIVLNWSKKRKIWYKGGREYHREDIIGHLRDILDGQYSKRYAPDRALFEERIRPHRFFNKLTSFGLPDIRVIVFNGVPIMAMLRLPTQESGGRANLHSGGIGIGIDIGAGITTEAVHKDDLITVHPETAMPLTELKIPRWNKVLETAVHTQQVSGLGYAGVDIVIDAQSRVLVLEANARPGLSIQIANLAGLNDRINRLRRLDVRSMEHGIRVAYDLFSERDNLRIKIEKKPIIRRIEDAEFASEKHNKKIKVSVKIDTGADSSSIGVTLARKLGYSALVNLLEKKDIFRQVSVPEARSMKQELIQEEWEEVEFDVVKSASGGTVRAYIPITITLRGRTIETTVSIVKRTHLAYSAIIGAKDLSGYYVHPV